MTEASEVQGGDHVSNFDTKYVKCPYFIENNNTYQDKIHQIRCEGVSDDNKISLVFPSLKNEQAYKIRYCYSIKGCHKCLIHTMLDGKWGEENG